MHGQFILKEPELCAPLLGILEGANERPEKGTHLQMVNALNLLLLRNSQKKRRCMASLLRGQKCVRLF